MSFVFMILGISTILGIAYLLSTNRKAIRLRPILWGLGLQITFGIMVLYWPTGNLILQKVADGVTRFLSFSEAGSRFLFGNLGNTQYQVSPLFQAGQFRNLPAFAAKLRSEEQPLARYLHSQFSPATQQLLAKYDGTAPLAADLERALTDELNRLLQGTLLYDQDRFAGIKLSRKAIVGVAGKVTGEALIELNRTLLEEAYPAEIKGYERTQFGFQFAFIVLCTIIFFSAFMSIMYHYGVMQKIVAAMAWLMAKTMGTSGSESLVAAANVFVGQTEAPLIIRPFISTMTMSEINAVMVAGFGTIAGGVMGAYIAMGVPAKYIITASLMAAPASLMIAKILFPETEESVTAKKVKIKLDIPTKNGIEAAAKGASDGLGLALNVGAMLIAFIALISLIDALLGWIDYNVDHLLLGYALNAASGEYLGWFPGSLKTILSYLLWPLAWLMGVPFQDCSNFAYLLGMKITLNEFVAYLHLSNMMKDAVLSDKAAMMAAFTLCGFANFSSIGIQIGGITPLVAPGEQDNLRSRLSRLGVRAMIGGALVSCLTATIAGFLVR